MHRRSRRPIVVVVLVAAIVIAAGVGAYAATSSDGPRYRTAAVTAEPVDETISAVGTAAQAASKTVAFPISGTVASVAVKPGDSVAAGQQLAALDATALKATLAQAQSTLAQARLTLNENENGQASGSSGNEVRGTAATGSTLSAQLAPSSFALLSTTTSLTTAPVAASVASPAGGPATSLSDAQQAVIAAQHQVDNDLAAVRAALAVARSECATTTPSSPSPTSSTSSTSSAVASAAESPTGSSSPTPGTTGTGSDACVAAEQSVLALQDTTTADQSALLTAEQGLDKVLSALAASLNSDTSTSGDSGGDQHLSTGSQHSSNSSGTTSSRTDSTQDSASASTAISAAQLAADQAAIDAASAKVTVAQQSLDQATLVAQTAGTVLSVGITAGATVTAASSTATITVVSSSAFTFGITVPVTDLPTLKLGDRASIVPDGTSTAIDGSVVKIGIAPTTSGGSTYAVTIGLRSTPATLRDGSSAQVTITTSSVHGALSVPTSALTQSGSTYSVRVLANGKVSSRAVKVGIRGTTRVQVLSGVAAGEQVVLADLRQALPTSDVGATSRRSSLIGGFGSGVPGAGGFGSGLTGGERQAAIR